MPIFPSQLTEKITLKLLWIENLKRHVEKYLKIEVTRKKLCVLYANIPYSNF